MEQRGADVNVFLSMSVRAKRLKTKLISVLLVLLSIKLHEVFYQFRVKSCVGLVSMEDN